MGRDNYIGVNKAIKDALVENRGIKLQSATEQKILELEKKLETAKLSIAEVADIRKQLIKLRSR